MMLSRNLRSSAGPRGRSSMASSSSSTTSTTMRNSTAAGSSTAAGQKQQQGEAHRSEPDLEAMIEDRDYSGAISVLEFYKREGRDHSRINLAKVNDWIGYCAFHLGEYERGMMVYQEMLKNQGNVEKSLEWLYLACCQFFLGEYEDAQKSAEKGLDSALKTRILFHCANKLQDEYSVINYHKQLDDDDPADQLCLASMQYMRTHIREATEIYKKMLVEESSYFALNVYVALCYYKMDFYDISLEVLNMYLTKDPLSPIALNLKACNHCKLFNGRAAEQELAPLIDLQLSSYSIDNPLIKHNLVVFRNGENALQVLPGMLDMIPEARLNLVIHYMHKGERSEAFELIKDLEPIRAQEFILKGVVYLAVGQQRNSREILNEAKKYFQVVGTSKSECDTIPGRQCMAACYFIMRHFSDVNIYLKSIKSFFAKDDDFCWNYGISNAAAGNFKEAEDVLIVIQNERYRKDPVCIHWLARCFIMNDKPNYAWELYLKMETSPDSVSLLQLIANDCYRIGSFYYAAKAFDVLERMDPNLEYWDGKRGACVGVFQLILTGKEQPDLLRDVIAMLKHTKNQPQAQYIATTMQKYAREMSAIA